MKFTDFVIEFLVNQGIDKVFGLTGGAVVHLFDSAAKNEYIKPVFCHHEQAAAFAAVAYARIKNSLGVAFVTTGPGGTNAITGVCAAWLDSIPCIYISGQTRIEHSSHGKPIRQLGTQEFDIISIVSPITKYAVMVDNPEKIKYYLQKACFIAQNGRPGPVWIDIPLNYQWMDIDTDNLEEYNYSNDKINIKQNFSIDHNIGAFISILNNAKRPLILAGTGIRSSNSIQEFKQLITKLKIPFVSSYNASDYFSTCYELYCGRPGIAGQRGANLAVQNCDLLIALGSHLCIPLTGTLFDKFAREAKVVMVDIDPVELEYETVKVNLSIQSDAGDFIRAVKNEIKSLNDFSSWYKICQKYKSYNSIKVKEESDFVNQYYFVEYVTTKLDSSDNIVVDGGGTVFYTALQAAKLKEGQRMITSSGIAPMGSGLPESIGACFANSKGRTICFIGDGSMQLNIQELQTIFHHNLPLKIFVFNNNGYLSIRHTQNGFLEGRLIGSVKEGGMSLPDYKKIAHAYGLKTYRIQNHKELKSQISSVLNFQGPVLCEIMISDVHEVEPTQGFIKNEDGTFTPLPLEDMKPFLKRDEFFGNMVVKPCESSKF